MVEGERGVARACPSAWAMWIAGRDGGDYLTHLGGTSLVCVFDGGGGGEQGPTETFQLTCHKSLDLVHANEVVSVYSCIVPYTKCSIDQIQDALILYKSTYNK